jgi:hypothetical protein
MNESEVLQPLTQARQRPAALALGGGLLYQGRP